MTRPRITWFLYRLDNGVRLGKFPTRKAALLTATVLGVPAYVSRCDDGYVSLGAIRRRDGTHTTYRGGH